MKDIAYILRFFKHLMSARHTGGFGVHSPYIFRLIKLVIYERNKFYVFDEVEKLRETLQKDESKIDITDFGTGKNRRTTISKIAKSSLKSKKSGQLLYRLVREQKPQVVLELGTSLGVSTAYMSQGCRSAQCYTIEGCPAIAKVARKNFRQLGLTNIELIQGNIDEKLPLLLDRLEQVDFVFIDANHTSLALKKYFDMLMPKITEKSMIVVDDIHWSADMNKAWNELKSYEGVVNSLDLFELGILLFNTDINKKHYRLLF